MNWKKINLYILFSCAFSWTVAAVIALSPIRISSITGMLLIGVLYMPGPALATFIIQKYTYRQPFKPYGWTFDKKAMKWILFTPLLFLALTVLTFAIIALLNVRPGSS